MMCDRSDEEIVGWSPGPVIDVRGVRMQAMHECTGERLLNGHLHLLWNAFIY